MADMTPVENRAKPEPTGHITPEQTGHATEELKQAVEMAERIVAATDVRSPTTMSAPVVRHTDDYHHPHPRLSLLDDAASAAEIRYAIKVLFRQLTHQAHTAVTRLADQVARQPLQSLATAAGVGFMLGVRRRR